MIPFGRLFKQSVSLSVLLLGGGLLVVFWTEPMARDCFNTYSESTNGKELADVDWESQDTAYSRPSLSSQSEELTNNGEKSKQPAILASAEKEEAWHRRPTRKGIGNGASTLIFHSEKLQVFPPSDQDIQQDVLLPRLVAAKGPPPVPYHPADHLVVKFKDSLEARARGNYLRMQPSTGLPNSEEVKNLSEVLNEYGVTVVPHFAQSSEVITGLTARARENTGRYQPDLAGIVRLNPEPQHRSQEAMINLAKALHASSLTEYVEFHALLPTADPEDFPPLTEDYTDLQTWQGPDPGLDAQWAWSQNILGQNVGFYNLEQAAHISHEDLVDASLVNLRPIAPAYLPPSELYPGGASYRHGTASLGCTLAQHNGYGMNGVAPLADGHFVTVWSQSDVYEPDTAIAETIADAEAGDIVLFELQTTGPTGEGKYVPMEYRRSTWDLTQVATDSGIIVIAAAGNGDVDLDSSPLHAYMNRGDSGAIIVGAGDADLDHDKRSSSTYGSRVDVHAWGVGVATTGYTAMGPSYSEMRLEYPFQQPDDVYYLQRLLQGYAPSWSGTSSASACIAAICVGIQSHAKSILNRPLTPGEMRRLLIQYSKPQGEGGLIGPIPNMKEVIQAVSRYYRPSKDHFISSARYHVPQSGVLGDLWHRPDFDDSQWLEASGSLGFDADDNSLDAFVDTDLELALYNTATSLYWRQAFDYHPAHTEELRLRLNYDDGAVVYLNGHEVYRSPLVSVNPAWDYEHGVIRSDNDTLTDTLVDLKDSAHLVSGKNVIAVHGINNRGNYLGGDYPNFLFATDDPDFFMQVQLLEIPTPLTFEQWAGRHGFDSDDPEQYAESDILAYAFNGRKGVSSEQVKHLGVDYLKVTYLRYRWGAQVSTVRYEVGDIGYSLQQSSNLEEGNWQAVPPAPSNVPTGTVENIVAHDDWSEWCSLYIPIPNHDERVFVRMKIDWLGDPIGH